jgi:hypothetical protein
MRSTFSTRYDFGQRHGFEACLRPMLLGSIDPSLPHLQLCDRLAAWGWYARSAMTVVRGAKDHGAGAADAPGPQLGRVLRYASLTQPQSEIRVRDVGPCAGSEVLTPIISQHLNKRQFVLQ